MTVRTRATTTSPSTVPMARSPSPPSALAKQSSDSDAPPARNFSWSETDEPHATRRRLILAKYPQVTKLFGTEPKTCYITLALLAIQVSMAYALRNSPWYVILPAAYIIGGTINHSLQLAVHELSHNLCWRSQIANRITAMIANLATGFPSSMSFIRYHMDHHQYQGVDGVDTDIPHALEVNYFSNTFMKVLWIFAQPLCYAFRPMIIKPKPFQSWEGWNFLVQYSFNAAIVYYFGFRSMAYLTAGTLLGLGLHPCAGHFIAEHYEFITGQETYSYYGICNFFNFNVGYHNEHHDFPKIPWSRLPELKKMAPEFYDNLPCYDSYVAVFWKYITDPEMGPFRRVKRRVSTEAYTTLDKTTDKRVWNPFRAICFTGMAATIIAIVWAVFYSARKPIAAIY